MEEETNSKLMKYKINFLKENNRDILIKLVEVHQNAFKKFGFRPWNYKDVLDLFNNGSHIFYYTSNNKILGFIIVNFSSDFNEIITVAVDNIYQNRNIGKALLMYIVNFPKLSGNLYLEVAVNNYKALYFYHKYGFKTLSDRKNYYLICCGKNKGKRVDALVMKLKL